MGKIGTIIAKYRKEQKLSQADMIQKLVELGYPIKRSAYSSWET